MCVCLFIVYIMFITMYIYRTQNGLKIKQLQVHTSHPGGLINSNYQYHKTHTHPCIQFIKFRVNMVMAW